MALSTRVAVSTCLAFICATCWLVNSVALPLVEMPSPLALGGMEGRANTRILPVVDTDEHLVLPARVAVEGRFARPSPAEGKERSARRIAEPLVVATIWSADTTAERAVLPPLFAPTPPSAVVAADHREDPGQADEPDEAETVIPEAIVAELLESEVLALAEPPADPEESVVRLQPVILEKADQPETVITSYKVQRGDTLVRIMRRLWNRDDRELLDALLAANPKVAKRPNKIFVGEVLTIPTLNPDGTLPVLASSAGGREAAGGSLAPKKDRQAAFSWYTIRERDTLVRIARRLLNDEDRWREIAKLNQLRNANRILPGRRIKLPLLRSET
jgi:nucleoid-associated protein YgaU